MTRKTFDPLYGAQRGLATDYVLIALGAGAALIALIYLLLT